MHQIKNITQDQLLIYLLSLHTEFTITSDGNVFVDNKPLCENEDFLSKIKQTPENIALVEIIMTLLTCCKYLIYHNPKYISIIMPSVASVASVAPASTKEYEKMKFGIYITYDGIYVERKKKSCIEGCFLGLFKWKNSQVSYSETVKSVLDAIMV